MRSPRRQTKFIVTLGPATESKEVLEELLENGVDVFRLNMAHAGHTWTRNVMTRIRSASEKTGREVAVMMDVKGPEIRTGFLRKSLQLKKGSRKPWQVGL